VTVGFADWKINDFFYSDDSFSIGKIIVFDDKVQAYKMFWVLILYR